MKDSEPAQVAAGSAPGIVRRATLPWAIVLGIGVAVAHATTASQNGWLPPVAHPVDAARSLHDALTTVAGWLLAVHLGAATLLPALPWTARLFWVALACAAGAAVVLARSMERAGLASPAAALVAGVAAMGPLWWAQSTTPLGGAPVTLVVALVLWGGVRTGAVDVPVIRPIAAVAAVGTVVVIVASASLRTELGTLGVVLAIVGALALALQRPGAGFRAAIVLGGATALGWLAGGSIGVAAAAPAAWWLVGLGIVQLGSWRGRVEHVSPWLVVGRLAWIALQG
jgi:hypothetical protein